MFSAPWHGSSSTAEAPVRRPRMRCQQSIVPEGAGRSERSCEPATPDAASARTRTSSLYHWWDPALQGSLRKGASSSAGDAGPAAAPERSRWRPRGWRSTAVRRNCARDTRRGPPSAPIYSPPSGTLLPGCDGLAHVGAPLRQSGGPQGERKGAVLTFQAPSRQEGGREIRTCYGRTRNSPSTEAGCRRPRANRLARRSAWRGRLSIDTPHDRHQHARTFPGRPCRRRRAPTSRRPCRGGRPAARNMAAPQGSTSIEGCWAGQACKSSQGRREGPAEPLAWDDRKEPTATRRCAARPLRRRMEILEVRRAKAARARLPPPQAGRHSRKLARTSTLTRQTRKAPGERTAPAASTPRRAPARLRGPARSAGRRQTLRRATSDAPQGRTRSTAASRGLRQQLDRQIAAQQRRRARAAAKTRPPPPSKRRSPSTRLGRRRG